MRPDLEAFRARGMELIEADLLDAGEFLRHDPAKLCRATLALVPERAHA